MGIRNLMLLIKKYAPGSYQPIEMNSLKGKTVAIDGTYLLCKFWYGREEEMIPQIYRYLSFLKEKEVKGIFVFDANGSVDAKKLAHAKRTKSKERYEKFVTTVEEHFPEFKDDVQLSIPVLERAHKCLNHLRDQGLEGEKLRTNFGKQLQELIEESEEGMVNDEDYQKLETTVVKMKKKTKFLSIEAKKQVIGVLDHFRVPYMYTPPLAEGEQVCGALVQQKYADYVASDDTDSAVYFDEKILRDFMPKGQVMQLDPKQMIKEMGVTREQFIEIAVLCGSDFAEGIKGIGYNRAFNLIKNHYHDNREEFKLAKRIFENEFLNKEAIKEWGERNVY